MVKVFNPPPNWPAPPHGWRPPPGWQPDAAWGPPPHGWALWVHANRHAFRNSALTAAITYACSLGVLQVAGWLTAYGAGVLFVPAVLATVAVALIARNSRSPWPWWKYACAIVVAMVLASLLTVKNIQQSSQ